MNILNIIDWVCIMFFGGTMFFLVLTAIFFLSVITGNNHPDNFY